MTDTSPDNSSVPTCPVCMDVIGKTNCCTTSCGHAFHTSCLMAWNKPCPVCRTNVIDPTPCESDSPPSLRYIRASRHDNLIPYLYQGQRQGQHQFQGSSLVSLPWVLDTIRLEDLIRAIPDQPIAFQANPDLSWSYMRRAPNITWDMVHASPFSQADEAANRAIMDGIQRTFDQGRRWSDQLLGEHARRFDQRSDESYRNWEQATDRTEPTPPPPPTRTWVEWLWG